MTTPQPPKILCSFHYYRKENIRELRERGRGTTMIMGDSGAFTAHASGTPIVYEHYADWVRRWQGLLFSYPVLDVIGDPEATWKSYRRMKRDGLTPLPVYHFRSPISYLKKYLDAGERYIALGGMVRKYDGESKQWIIRCFQEAGPYGAVFHGFGRTLMTDLRDFPWYSVDSTSFFGGARFGQFTLFDGHDFRTVYSRKPKDLYRQGALLRAHGATPQQLDTRSPRDNSLGVQVGVIAYRRCEEWLRRRHGPIPGVRPGDPPGPHIFLANGAMGWLREVVHIGTDVLPGPYFTGRRT